MDGVDQGLGARKPVFADRRSRRHPQTPHRVFAGVGVEDGFLDVLHRQKADATLRVVDHQQLLDAPLLQKPFRVGEVDGLPHRRQILRGHQFGNGRMVVLGEPHVAIGQNAHETPFGVHDREAGYVVLVLQMFGVRQGLVGAERHRLVDDAALKPFDPRHLRRLLIDGKIAVQHPKPAGLSHRNRHLSFGHRVHRR